eukprot:6204499-Pleurochrysis_carterae.AAC.2
MEGKKEHIQETTKWSGIKAITNVRENLGTVIFMWSPSHVGIFPNVLVDNITAQEQEAAPEGMVTGLISKQVKSRPII